ncbi:hypothetical protein M758_1G210900 [Ceratodon purpureus]|uniref:C2HC/C3H-type domain-containing protein n=1 Tax=Ceratodon purpureus TaxID=3225 RepID=A0A8T0J7N6_CERPU|nr:hypothetical protein KC19_1G210800 [Ceratodon purpureus]KAG0630882.1 hypothetical protein M758_1G210900 [Ceratodon purpureus]
MSSLPEKKSGEAAAEGQPGDVKEPERKPSEKASEKNPVLERKSSGRKLSGEVPKDGGERLERKSSQELKERHPGERPHFRVCYLCKREFGSQSYPIHIPQCQKKWLLEEAKKPENERRRLPPPPYDEEPIKVGGPPQEDDFGGEAKSAFEASLTQCPNCQRQFVPKGLKHHSSACTEAKPFFKPAGTGLNSMSLTNRLVPGEIAGSQHGNASAQPKLSKKIGVFTNWKIINEQRAADPNRSPCGKDPGQSSKPKSNDPCADCGTRDRPDSKFCSACGKKRPEEQSLPSSPASPKEEDQEVVIAWVGKSPSDSPEVSGKAPAGGGRETPISLKDQDKLIVQSSDSPVEIVIQMRSPTPDSRQKST